MDSMQTAAWRQPGVPSCTWSWENTSAFRVSFRPGSSKFSPRREAKNESKTWMATGNGFRERVPNLTQEGISNCRSMPRQEPVQVVEPFTEFWAKGTEKGSVLDIVNSSPSTFAGAGDGSDNRVCLLPDVR